MIWEYLFTYFNRETFEVKEEQPEAAGTYQPNELGSKGWELISISGWQSGKAIALWKRQKSPEYNGKEVHGFNRYLSREF